MGGKYLSVQKKKERDRQTHIHTKTERKRIANLQSSNCNANEKNAAAAAAAASASYHSLDSSFAVSQKQSTLPSHPIPLTLSMIGKGEELGEVEH